MPVLQIQLLITITLLATPYLNITTTTIFSNCQNLSSTNNVFNRPLNSKYNKNLLKRTPVQL